MTSIHEILLIALAVGVALGQIGEQGEVKEVQREELDLKAKLAEELKGISIDSFENEAEE